MRDIIRFERENCKNCYKCIRHCPVKAIRIIEQQAQIITSECIFCEQCTLVCPQKAKEESNALYEIRREFRSGKKLIASLHPAYAAMYQGEKLDHMIESLLLFGFEEVRFAVEACGPVVNAYERVIRSCAEGTASKKVLLSGSCPVVVQLVRKHYPELLPHLSPVLSLMEAHAAMLKNEYPDALVVAISPCISLMSEQDEKENSIDYIISFREMQECIDHQKYLFQNRAVVRKLPVPDIRGLALSDGLTRQLSKQKGVHYVHAEGLKNCRRILTELREEASFTEDGGLIFVELSACPNGCLGGPSFADFQVPLLKTKLMLQEAGDQSEESAVKIPGFSLPERSYAFSDEAMTEKKIPDYSIRSILSKMGKNTPEDELNCGGCGYPSCREMAAAVLRGKAELNMCVPYMRAREEHYSDKIINAMPGLLITVDYDLRILHTNAAAAKLLDPETEHVLIGEPLGSFMDDFSLVELISFNKPLVQDQVELANGTILDRVMTNDQKNRQILCVMKDITKEKKRTDELIHQREEAVAMADKLMADQLKIVHDIAGYLGETAADTKIAIDRLKQAILRDEEK